MSHEPFPDLDITADDFALMGLERRYPLDRALLDARWRDLQSQVHPDRFVGADAAAQRLAMQWSARVNQAHRRLRDPLARGAYLCELAGVPVDAERNTAMPPAFLMQQMSWREALDDAVQAADATAVEQLDDEVTRAQRAAYDNLSATLERGDHASAAAQVRSLMFMDKFASEVQRRLDAMETS